METGQSCGGATSGICTNAATQTPNPRVLKTTLHAYILLSHFFVPFVNFVMNEIFFVAKTTLKPWVWV